jgi:acetyl-CoA carboxylase biotin carboxyl carrier protein
MDLRKLKKLIDLVEESGISELELTEGEEKVRISRALMHSAAPVTQYVSAPAPALANSATAAPATSEPVAAAVQGHIVKSPMVGTFYRAASPTDKPFIGIGDSVDENSNVCIIEAMKVMNEIKAELRGTIARVLVEDGKPVQYGQPLFELKA